MNTTRNRAATEPTSYGDKDLYLKFVHERHAVWERRQTGAPGPWTDDPILQQAKFTNVYRVLDRCSQYVLREQLQAPGTWEDKVLRAFLFRFTNRPEPWQALDAPPTIDSLRSGLLRYAWEVYDGPVFGIAYRNFGPAGMTRLDWTLRTAEENLTDEFLAELKVLPMALRHAKLKTIDRIGDFMAMQILTDIGYFDRGQHEDQFVAAGPGSRAGVKLLGYTDPWGAFVWAWDEVDIELYGRRLSLMDVQNTFCEFSKYHRYWSGGGVPRKGYRPNEATPPEPVFPAHWAICA